MLFTVDNRMLAFYKGVNVLPEQMKFARMLWRYADIYEMTFEDFVTMPLDELYAFANTFNAWALLEGQQTYSPVYMRSFQGYLKKAISVDQLDKALMDSALVEHAVKKLISIIDDDSFQESNLVSTQHTESETGTGTKKQKYDKLKAIDILLKYAGTMDSKGKENKSPSNALVSLMQSLAGVTNNE